MIWPWSRIAELEAENKRLLAEKIALNAVIGKIETAAHVEKIKDMQPFRPARRSWLRYRAKWEAEHNKKEQRVAKMAQEIANVDAGACEEDGNAQSGNGRAHSAEVRESVQAGRIGQKEGL